MFVVFIKVLSSWKNNDNLLNFKLYYSYLCHRNNVFKTTITYFLISKIKFKNEDHSKILSFIDLIIIYLNNKITKE